VKISQENLNKIKELLRKEKEPEILGSTEYDWKLGSIGLPAVTVVSIVGFIWSHEPGLFLTALLCAPMTIISWVSWFILRRRRINKES